MEPTISVNLDDDVGAVTKKLRAQTSPEVVLAVPKKAYLFADSINLRLLKKQADLLGKSVAILTMDEKGRLFAKEAGFDLRYIKGGPAIPKKIIPKPVATPKPKPQTVTERKIVRPVARSKEFAHPAVAVRDTFFPDFVQDKQPSAQVFGPLFAPPKSRRFIAIMTAFASLAVILVAVVVFLILPSATLTVYARNQSITRDFQVIGTTSLTTVDAPRLSFPAKTIQKTMDYSTTLDTTGKQDTGNPATGTVKVYNLTGNSINLRANTTTLTVGTKQYKFTKDQNGLVATAPGADTKNIVEIKSVEGGADANLPAGTKLEITNQVFGSKPTLLYAIAQSPITGGTSNSIPVVSQNDLDLAGQKLAAAAVVEYRKELEKQNLTLPDKAYTFKIENLNVSAKVGDSLPSFQVSGKVSINGVAFNSQDLVDLLRTRIGASLTQGSHLQGVEADSLTFSVDNLDLEGGGLKLNVKYETKAVSTVDSSLWKADIAGKSAESASKIILEDVSVDHVDIKISPAWQKSLPRLQGKIKVNIVNQ